MNTIRPNTETKPVSQGLETLFVKRQTHIDRLSDAWTKCCQEGEGHFAFIAGEAGTGKTTLVNHLETQWVTDQFFLRTKFMELADAKPYQEVTGLIVQFEAGLSTRPTATYNQVVEEWRQDLAAFSKIYADLLPESLIWGHQEIAGHSTNPSTVIQVKQAMLALFQKMIALNGPLVVFWDDLQWADQSTLELISYLHTNLQKAPVFFIGAYRPEEVQAAEAFHHVMEGLMQSAWNYLHLKLSNFTAPQLTDWLTARLKCGGAEVEELSALLMTKTLGNPLYVTQFFRLLKERGIVSQAEGDTQWQWSGAAIRSLPATENIVPLLQMRLQLLSEQSQALLQWLACLYAPTSNTLLQQLMQVTDTELEEALGPCLNREFVVRQSGGLYRIAHDKILQMVHEHMTAVQKQQAHSVIAACLISDDTTDAYQVAHHLTEGRLPETPEQISDYVHFHHQAGLLALRVASYHQSSRYLQRCMEYLTAEAWESDYSQTFSIHLNAMAAAGYDRDESLCEEIYQTMKGHVKDVADEAEMIHQYSLHLLFFARHDEAFALIKQALSQLGFAIEDQEAKMGEMTGQLMQQLTDTNFIDQLATVPEADRRGELVHQLFNLVIVYIYTIAPQNIGFYAFLWASSSMKIGISPPVTDAFSIVAMIYVIMGNHQAGHQYGQLATNLATEMAHPVYAPKSVALVNAYVSVWHRPFDKTADELAVQFDRLVANGEWIWANGTLFSIIFIELAYGNDLKLAYERFERLYQIYQRPESQGSFGTLPGEVAMALKRYMVLDTGVSMDPEALEEEAKASLPHISSLGYLLLAKLYLMQGDYGKSLAMSEANYAAMVEQSACGGQVQLLLFHFYYVIALTRVGQKQRLSETQEARLSASLDRLKQWAALTPANFEAYYLLALANERWRQGTPQQSYGLLMQAIGRAKNDGLLLLAAMAYEHAGSLAQEDGLQISRGYYIEAYHLYGQCGAGGKAKALYERHLQGRRSQLMAEEVTVPTIDPDVKALLASALALSRQTRLAQLLRQLLEVIRQATGAERVLIALKEKDRLLLEGRHTEKDTAVLEGVVVEEGQVLPTAYQLSNEILYQVANTRQMVLLGDAVHTAGPFKNTAYVQQNKPLSIMAYPLIHQGDLMGVLYLENNSEAYAFTNDRTEVLALLSAQITTAIQNAGLYSSLEVKVAERTRQLQSVNEELASLNAYQEQMTSLIAHDLKSPLSNIIGLASETSDRSAPAKIHLLGQQMEALILDFLNTRRLETSHVTPVKETVPVSRLAETAVEQVAWKLRQRGMVMDVQVDRDLSVMVEEGLIVRVLVNLFNNAMTHNPDSRNITLSVTSSVGNRVLFEVTDHGQPIAREHRQDVFEPYHSSHKGGKSTGLGLTFCKTTITTHGGTIGLRADEINGNTFWFLLAEGRPVEPSVRVYDFQQQEERLLLDDQAIAMLSPQLAALSRLRVNQLSAIISVLREVDAAHDVSIERWLGAVETAVYASDEISYKRLLDVAEPKLA